MGVVEVREVEGEHPDVVRLVELYFDELRARLGRFEPPSPEQRRADAGSGVVLVVYEDELAVGTGTLRLLEDATGEVKRMFIAPEARGRGHARRVLRALEEKAQAFGCTRVVLDTAAPLQEAVSLYVREGYAAIARYNDNPYAARWFEKRLLRDHD